MSKVDKSNPHYYKTKIDNIIKTALDNGITIGYEISSNGDKVKKIEVWLMDNDGEFASTTTYDAKIMEVK